MPYIYLYISYYKSMIKIYVTSTLLYALKKERQIAVVCGVKGLKKINSPNQFSSGFSKQLAKRVVFMLEFD